ncbi:transposase family protein [Halalkalibacillus halophilus]|uniref:transposase family protein n=1 Tax=Halalkalibacillus halophilus TaxID=392827 RepID=UPI000426355F|nr:transposase family protein [Halalkalibacillus halophilus]
MLHNITLPGLKSFQTVGTREEEGMYHVYIEKPRETTTCPACESLTNTVHDYRWQKIKHNRVLNRRTNVWYRKRRYA